MIVQHDDRAIPQPHDMARVNRRQEPPVRGLTLRFAGLCAVVWLSLFVDEVIVIVLAQIDLHPVDLPVKNAGIAGVV